MSYIQIKNVSKKINNQLILDNVNFNVSKGEVVGIRGVNGSGKTILLKLIAGLVQPSSGSIFVNEKQIGLDVEFPVNIGILIEYPKLISNYTGFQNLKFLALIKNIIGDDEIRNAMESVNLSANSNKKYKKYSLGMKQRLGIAQAFMENQELILLDEPTNALDEDGVLIVEKKIHEAKRMNKTIILTSHDKEFIERVSDKVYAIYEGVLKE